MRVMFRRNPGEWLWALVMAASPIVGSIWVTPDVTKWTVFSVGCATVLGVIAAALRPDRDPTARRG